MTPEQIKERARQEYNQAVQRLLEACQAAINELEDCYDVSDRKEYPFPGAGLLLRRLRSALAGMEGHTNGH